MKKYYEAYDERYKQIHSLHLEWGADVHSPILDEIMDKFNLTLESKILELGCGEGRDAIYLMKHGYDICASDISSEAVSFCKKKASEYVKRFIVLNACEDTLDETYDFIYSIAVLHMLVLEEDRNKFLTFIREHLKESGIGLILSMGDGEMERSSGIDSAFKKQERIHIKTGTKVCIASTSCKIVSFPVLEKELEQNGLIIMEKGITSIKPDFPIIMYVVVKRK